MPPRRNTAAKRQRKTTPRSKKGAASIPVEEAGLPEAEAPKNVASEETAVVKEESTVVNEHAAAEEEAASPSADTALEPTRNLVVVKEELAVAEDSVVAEEAVMPSSDAAAEPCPKEVLTTTEELKFPEAVANGEDDDELEDPEEIEGDENEGSEMQEEEVEGNDAGGTAMYVEEGVDQEIFEGGVDDVEGTEGSENDNTGGDEDGDESGSDDEGTEEETEPDEVEDDAVGEDEEDEEESGSDDEEDDEESGSDDEETEEEEDPSAYMHGSLGERKKQEFEIFVGGLDKEAVEDDLTEVFAPFGVIQAVRVVKHPITQKSKGFAFIRYATAEQAKKALTELKDGAEVKGKHVRISASQDNDTLYMGNICKTWTKDHVLTTLKGYGVEQIEEIFLPDDPKKEGKSKGFALLEFGSHSDAMAAFQRLRKPDAVFGRDSSAKVAFAQSFRPSKEALLQVKTVFVEGLPASWDEDTLKEHCKQYGKIEKVMLPRKSAKKRAKKRKDFGFVEFASRESAVACVDGINSALLGEREIKVKANLAKPQNKGRLAKMGVRGGFKVKKDDENLEANSFDVKSNAKAKISEGEGKANGKLTGNKASKPSKGKTFEEQGGGAPQGRQKNEQESKNTGGPSQGRQEKERESKGQGGASKGRQKREQVFKGRVGGPSRDGLKKEQQSKGVKRHGRGLDSSRPSKRAPSRDSLRKEQQSKGVKRHGRGLDSSRPSKRARDSRNTRGRSAHGFGHQKKSHFEKPKASHYIHPAAYRDPYARDQYAPRYGAPAVSYHDHAYSAAPAPRQYYSDMEPHAGYIGTAPDRVRDPYAYGGRSAAGYDSQGRIPAGHIRGSAPSSSYPHQYSSYSGYEASYRYPSTAAYAPRRVYY